jgi:membrane-bound lytic murein transglycosylase D
MFEDWELALAAYNWGENAVQRAIAKNVASRKPTRYGNLKMPAETRGYLPRLQAIKDLIDNYNVLGFQLPHVPNRPYFVAIRAVTDIDIVKAAEFAQVSVEEFQLLNAGYAGPVLIPADDRQIVLPVDKVDSFHARMDNYNEPLTSWRKYTLKKGDTLQNLARRFSTSISRLREANGFLSRNRPRPGETLLVPIKERARAPAAEARVPASIGIVSAGQRDTRYSANGEDQIHRVD